MDLFSRNIRTLRKSEKLTLSSDKEEPERMIPRTKNLHGVLFLIPMFAVVLVVLISPLSDTLRRALTAFNGLEVPRFIGLENYKQLFLEDEIFQIAIKNTITNAFIVTLFVGTLTLVIAWVIRPAHKALRYTVVVLFNLISVFVLAGGLAFLFSGDAYGFINSRLMESGSIKDPIPFINMYASQIQQLQICLILFGPMLSVLMLLKTRRVSENKLLRLLFPLEHSLHVYIAGGLPILLIPICWGATVSAVGMPSTNYAAHTIVEHFIDHGSIRFNLGYAAAISVVSLIWTAMFLVGFLVLSCGAMHVVALLKREVLQVQNPSNVPKLKTKKIAAYILSGVLILSALFLLFPLFVVFMNSFKDTSEVFVFPQKILPKEFNTQNYADLFSMDIGNHHFSKRLFNMVIVPLLPALVLTAVSGVSAYGVAYFDYKARRILYVLILLSFVLLPTTFLPNYVNTTLINHYIPIAFYAAFFSGAPLIGFVYMKSVIERARQYGCSLYTSVPLNCIPVVFITYVMCFINPFVNGLLYSHPGFTIYFFDFQSAGTARIGIDSAAKIILTGITFGFLLVAAVTAMMFFPREKKQLTM